MRNVKVVMGDIHVHKKGQRIRNQPVLERPMQKLILLLKAENGDKDSLSGSLVQIDNSNNPAYAPHLNLVYQ